MQNFLELFKLKKDRQFYMKALVFCSLLIALGVVSELFLGINIPLAGTKSGDKINIASSFMIIAGYMFGPLWGGLASIVQDIIGCILKGDTPLPQFIIAPFLTGFLAGFFPFFFKKISKAFYGTAIFCTFIATFAFLLNSISIVLTYSLTVGFFPYILLRLPTLPIKIVLYTAIVYIIYIKVLPQLEKRS